MLARISGAKTRIGYQKKVLLKYRVRRDSLSGDSMQRIEREIDSYRRVKKQFELDALQREIIENQLVRLNAELEIERGKAFLLDEDFAAAHRAFRIANEYRKSKRLRLPWPSTMRTRRTCEVGVSM